MKSNSFSRIFKIKKSQEIKKLLKYGRKFKTENRNIIFFIQKSELRNSRFCILLTRKVRKSVYRNKVKRKFREIFRIKKNEFNYNSDIAVMIKDKIDPDYRVFNNIFVKFMFDAGLSRKEKEKHVGS